jgi:spore germination protein YaaH
MKRILTIVATAMLAVSDANAAPQGRIVGYIAAFKGLDSVTDERLFRNYTQLDLAFVNPNLSGEVTDENGLVCAPAGNGAMISDAQLRRLVALAHAAGATLLASLGGAVIPPCGGRWSQLLSPEMRPKVVAAIVEMVDRYGMDGVDVDLEGDLMRSIDRDGNYTPFVNELANALHARSKLVTAATGSGPGNMVPAESLAYFDVIGIMSYDAVGPSWGTPGGEHSTYAQSQADLALWIAKGVPASKLALGMPFYGHAFGMFPESWALHDIASRFGNRQLSGDVVGERCAGCSYITFNGLQTLERKATLAGAWGAGVMVWEIGDDLPGDAAIRHVSAGYRKGLAYFHHRSDLMKRAASRFSPALESRAPGIPAGQALRD